jgi:hypothetical protein
LESERSTGVSLPEFLNGGGFELYNFRHHDASIAATGVAVAGRLYLFLKDAIENTTAKS